MLTFEVEVETKVVEVVEAQAREGLFLGLGKFVKDTIQIAKYSYGSCSFEHGNALYNVAKVVFYDGTEEVCMSSWFTQKAFGGITYDVVSIGHPTQKKLVKALESTKEKHMQKGGIFFIRDKFAIRNSSNNGCRAVLYLPIAYLESFGYSIIEESNEERDGKVTFTKRRLRTTNNELEFSLGAERTYNMEVIKRPLREAIEQAETRDELRELLQGALDGTGITIL